MTAVDSATNHWLLVYTLIEAAAALLQVPAGPSEIHLVTLLRRPIAQVGAGDTHHICLWTNLQHAAGGQWLAPESMLAMLVRSVLGQGFLDVPQAIEVQVGVAAKAFHANDLQQAKHVINHWPAQDV